jgi:hypothetical protein
MLSLSSPPFGRLSLGFRTGHAVVQFKQKPDNLQPVEPSFTQVIEAKLKRYKPTTPSLRHTVTLHRPYLWDGRYVQCLAFSLLFFFIVINLVLFAFPGQ